MLWRWFGLALVVFALLAKGDAAMLSVQPNAATYLVFYDRLRGFRNVEIASVGLRENAVAQNKFDEVVYQRNLGLRAHGAVSEDEFRASDLSRKVSEASVQRYDHEAKSNRADVEAHEILLKAILGNEVGLEPLFGRYSVAWEEQCVAFQYRIKEALARKDLADFRLGVGEKLHKTGAIPPQTFEQLQTTQVQSVIEVQASQELAARCKEGVPSYALLQTLIKRN